MKTTVAEQNSRKEKPSRSTRHRAAVTVSALALSAWCAFAGDGPGPTPAVPPSARFAVMSDIHFYNPRLGTSGQAFEDYINQDPKLLRESEAIFDSALQSIVEQQVQFVLIPGDLTKDGELIDHVRVARRLAKLRQRGIQVFVVPGNHDINNPDAFAYRGDTSRRVPNVSPKLFQAIYKQYGYREAIARDTNSLSYVAEPVPGLWLLGIDSCKYQESKELGYPVVSGRISSETLAWLVGKLQEAQAQGKRVIAFMHHGVNQHFIPQAQLFPDFLVDDFANVSAQLAGAGLKVVFTGHYHAQDAAYPLDATGTPMPTLCDVETGSLAMYPCAFRIVTLDEAGLLHIQSQRVTQIEADTGGVPFQQYALDFLAARLPALATYQLMNQFQLPQAEAAQVAPFVADALIAGYAGDEAPSAQTQAVLNNFVGSPEPLHTLGQILWGMWTDLPPGDNDLVVPLAHN